MLEGNKDNFNDLVINSKNKVVVDFYANWCGPCKMLKPILESISLERKDINFVSIDVDLEEEIAAEYNIMSIPCIILFQNGKEIGRSIGFKPKDDIISFIGE